MDEDNTLNSKQAESELSENEPPKPRNGLLSWFLGFGNFVLVSLLGTYFSYKTQDLESKISTVQTAGQFIEIVADEQAPGYAKSLALNAIFDEELLSRDLVLETAYRIEDDILERTIVGPLLYQIASGEELLELPFGYFDFVKALETPEGAVEITLNGWALDDQGWSSDRKTEDVAGLPLFQVELGGALRCEYPYRKGLDCTVTLGRRSDIAHIYPQYPDASMSGFRVAFTEISGLERPTLLTMRLIDRVGRSRIIYSRCIALSGPLDGELAVETPHQVDGCGDR